MKPNHMPIDKFETRAEPAALGECVIRLSYSALSGRLAKVDACKITKITKAGYRYALHSYEKFMSAPLDQPTPWPFRKRTLRKFQSVSYRVYLVPDTPRNRELAGLAQVDAA